MPVRYDRFAAWSETTWMRRGAPYERLKAQIAAGILSAVAATMGLRGFPQLLHRAAAPDVAVPPVPAQPAPVAKSTPVPVA